MQLNESALKMLRIAYAIVFGEFLTASGAVALEF